MNTRKLLSVAFIASAFAMTCLPLERLYAQSSDVDLTAVITSASGAERHLVSHERVLGRAGLRPEQRVTVTLQFPNSMAGMHVRVVPFDGGEVTQLDLTQDLSVDENGRVAFYFQAASPPGLYRLLALLGTNVYRLEFYVLDVQHLQNNPPRLHIVD